MPIYILVTNYNYDLSLFRFEDNNDFLKWYDENCDGVESLRYMNPEKDILFIDSSNLVYAYVRYFDSVEPNVHKREIIAYDPTIDYYEGSVTEFIVLHSHAIESFELIGSIKTS